MAFSKGGCDFEFKQPKWEEVNQDTYFSLAIQPSKQTKRKRNSL